MTPVVKNPPASAGDLRDPGSICWSGRSSGGGHGNALQYSSWENPMDRGTWQAIVGRVIKCQTWLKQLSIYAGTFLVLLISFQGLFDKYSLIFFLSPENITPHEGRCCIMLTTVHSRHTVNIYYMYKCVQWYIYNGLAQKSEIWKWLIRMIVI